MKNRDTTPGDGAGDGDDRGRSVGKPIEASGAEDRLDAHRSWWAALSVGGLLGVRRGERRMAGLFFIYFLLLTTSQYAAKSVRQSSYIDSLGAENLPWVYLLVALVSFPMLVLYARLAARTDDRKLIVVFCIALIAGLIVFFWLWGFYQGWILALAFYVWMTITFGMAVSQFWSYANNVFDPRQARRLFALIGAGGLLGGIPGGQLARLVTEVASTRHTLLAAALVAVLMMGVVAGIHRWRPPAEPTRFNERPSRIREAKGGFQALKDSRLLGLIALLMLLSVMVAQTVDIQFYWVIENHTTDLDQRTRVVGNFFTVMGLVGFAFQLLFTSRIHRAFGVGVGMRFLPFSVGGTTMVLMVAFGIMPAAVFIVAWVLKVGETSFRHSIDQATRELLFLPVAEGLRRRAKAFIDVFVQRLGKGLVAVLLLPVTFGLVGIEQVGWLTMILVVMWLAIVVPTRREYVAAFRRGLKQSSNSDDGMLDTEALITVTTLVESLGSADPRKVLHSLELLSSHGQSRLVPPVLLHHHDAEVRRRTLEVLEQARRTDAAGLIEQTIGDEDPDVRSTAIRTLAALKGEDAAAMMLPHLDDADPRLRAAAIALLIGGPSREAEERARASLLEMCVDGEAQVREEAAKALGQIREPEGSESLVLLLYDADLEVVRQAVAAVRMRLSRDGENPVYIPILISLMGRRRVKHLAREAVVAFGESALEALMAFMDSEEERIWVRRAVPKTIALLGGSSAAEALLSRVDASDRFMRSKVVEALVYLRSRDDRLRFKAAAIQRHVNDEVRRYLRCFADLWAVGSIHQAQLAGPLALWQSDSRVPTLLQETLAQRMASSVRDIAHLLELLLPPSDVRASFRSLASGSPRMRARALEYLDNTLSGSLRRSLFAVIDDVPAEEKLRQASQLFEIEKEGPKQTIERLIRTNERSDPSALVLILAALYAVKSERLTALYPLVEQVRDQTTEPTLAETAAWVLRRSGMRAGEIDPKSKAPAFEDREASMPEMARIEMVVFFQGVDLFAHCTADQLVQLAAIAQEQTWEKGQPIFAKNEPPEAFFCVVEGKVELRGDDGVDLVVGSGGRFGVLDILADRLRRHDAVAVNDTRALVIEADDLLDLLSVNIDIVKALFKQLTGLLEETTPPGS